MKTLKNCLLTLSLCLLLGACDRSASSGGIPQAGHWLLINYWATWCAPCREEIPALNAIDAQYPDVSVIGANYDGLQGEELAAAIAEMGITFDSMSRDPATELGQQRPQVLPTTYLLNPAGELAAVLTGPQTIDSLRAALGR